MQYGFENSFSMLSGFFGLTARQSKHNRSAFAWKHGCFRCRYNADDDGKIPAFTLCENSEKYVPANPAEEAQTLFPPAV